LPKGLPGYSKYSFPLMMYLSSLRLSTRLPRPSMRKRREVKASYEASGARGVSSCHDPAPNTGRRMLTRCQDAGLMIMSCICSFRNNNYYVRTCAREKRAIDKLCASWHVYPSVFDPCLAQARLHSCEDSILTPFPRPPPPPPPPVLPTNHSLSPSPCYDCGSDSFSITPAPRLLGAFSNR
jgi:hypothetical protein